MIYFDYDAGSKGVGKVASSIGSYHWICSAWVGGKFEIHQQSPFSQFEYAQFIHKYPGISLISFVIYQACFSSSSEINNNSQYNLKHLYYKTFKDVQEKLIES